ncbi:MAG: amidophosphoribosyltransferase [Paludibacteraceae bacterium]|nr:amidophosphoribosyltransferase [Paludibacteraceae bacterium]
METIKHECGIAMIRLLKPLSYFQQKYGSWTYGLNQLYLMMEKERNRGQEGAGLACLKMKAQAGEEYMFRERAEGSGAINDIFDAVNVKINSYSQTLSDADYAERYIPFAGEIYLGHLRYSTTGKNGLSYVHPFLRRNNWRARNICLCGNFNMTNVDEIFADLTSKGQHPRIYSDTYIILEQIGHRLDRESERLFALAQQNGLQGMDITRFIEDNICIENILKEASAIWDGGYVISGMTGSGEAFAMRDPWGIRTAFYYADDEKIVVASERPVIQTAFNLEVSDVHELQPGQAIVIGQNGQWRLSRILQPASHITACSFERIYFSRSSDADIYLERKALGRNLMPQILEAINYDIENTVFSFIPNTAEVAFYGMTEAIEQYLCQNKLKQILALNRMPTEEETQAIMSCRVRREKVAHKDIKLRTFITEGKSRNNLVAHVYDITYGSLRPGIDNLVIIDDSIVRGTTLKESIIRILDRLHPKKMVLVSSSPQIRYPDYYGIDMSSMHEFIAFRAAVELLIENGQWDYINDIYLKCIAQRQLKPSQMVNYVKDIYSPFTADNISHKMAQMLRHNDVTSEVQIVFQSLEGLHNACPDHKGDWYFTGNYPTPGGVRRINEAFISYIEETYYDKTQQL